jgi:CubicO group peptidase (beta-lactamase class C family)
MKKALNTTGVLVVLFYFLLTCSCNTETGSTVYEYSIPLQTGDGWGTASLNSVGMDEGPLKEMMNDLLNRNDHYLHGLLIIKDGKLVFEEYFDGYEFDYSIDVINSQDNSLDLVFKEFNLDTVHMCSSMTKSVTSIVFGIARDQGYIPNLNEKMFSFFPDYSYLKNSEKVKITVAHMLAMATGLPWHDDVAPVYDPRNDEYQMLYHDNPIHFILDRDVVSAPGTTFHYNSGITVLLGEIIRRQTGQHMRIFARENLFTPLGINNFIWYTLENDQRITHASGMLYLRPRDMAKLGQLYLNEGVWNGNRIVSAQWVRDSIKQSINIPADTWEEHRAFGYGYQWWLDSYTNRTVDAFAAKGWGGQFFVVIPEKNLVFVHTAGAYEDDNMWNVPYMFYDLLERFILPAINE